MTEAVHVDLLGHFGLGGHLHHSLLALRYASGLDPSDIADQLGMRRRSTRRDSRLRTPEALLQAMGPPPPVGLSWWYDTTVSHISQTSHIDHPVRLGDRGRLVLPAEIRRELRLEPGDELVARLEGDGVRLVSRRQLARQARGALSELAPGRDLVAELLEERRAEGEQA